MWLRRAVQRPYGPRRAPRLGGRALGFALATFLLSVAPSQLLAQGQSAGTTRSAKTVLDTRVKANPNSKMLVRANELRYDYQREQISAVGNVQIYYDGAVLEADRVTHDRKANRLSAQGNVRYQTKDGNVIRTDEIDLDADFRDGFINSLQVETADRTRFAAARAERSGGNLTVLESGVYTACEPCKKDPTRPPLWQVKAARIIHNESERVVQYENASLEFFGVPIAYVPLLLASGSDREACNRISAAGIFLQQPHRHRRKHSLLLGTGPELRPHRRRGADDAADRSARDRRISPPHRQWRLPASARRASSSRTRRRSSTRARRRPVIAISAGRLKRRASFGSTVAGSGAGMGRC